ncbi:MAG: hypothetical protein J5986_09270 [Roseburia sp.]|nr:hypothetical protein [Roseburia sp.]
MQEKISKHVEDFLNFLRNAQSEYTWSMEKEKEQDELTQDYLHLLELENLNYHERAKIAGYLSEARQERRQYKDSVEELKSVVEFVQGNKKFLNELEQVLGEVRKQEKYHMNRSYRPRVLDEETIERVKGK